MTVRNYSSISQETTLVSALNASATTMVVASASGLLGGVTIPSGQTFTVVIDPDTALEEIVDVVYPSAAGSSTLTIQRSVESGSSGIEHSAGAKVRHMAIGRDFREANTHIENTTTAHGLTIADVITTTNTKTLTNKTLTSPTITGTGAIVNADINASAAIDKTKISGTAITAADTGTVTSTMIANGTIVDADVNASAAIAKTKLNLGGTITSADLVDGTIVATDIADGTITAAKMVSDPYARANHTGSQTASTISDFDTQVRTNRLDQMAAPTSAVNANSQKITSLGTPTSNADAATKLYVDTKVADLVNSAPSTLDTLGEIATAIEAGGTVYESFVLKSGSTMTGALTLSGAPSSNLHAATKAYVDTVAGSATAAAASAAAAATTYDNFDDRYLGSKSTAPSVDNDGNALIEGALYWNSVDNAMYAWTGSEWGSISSTAEIYRFRFTAAGGETTISGLDDNGLTLSYLPGKEQVYLNGVLLVRTTDYTASNGSSLTSLAALAANDIVEVITFTSFEVADAIARTVFDAKGDLLVGTAADTVGKLTVGTNGQFLKADSSTATGLAWGAVAGQFLKADSSTATGLAWGAVAGALAQPTEPSSPSDGQIWIDTDGTAPTTVVTRWTEQPAAGTTVLTGNDDYSIPLAYSPGYEQVFLNGVLLSRSGSEYTATNGTSITLASATVAGDIVEVICPLQISTTDTYTQAAVNNAFVANTGYFAAGKNAIINGDFKINQRAFSSITSTNYGFDRWRFLASGDGTATNSTQAFTLGAAPVAGYEGTNFCRIVTTGQTQTTIQTQLQQRIESVRTFSNQTVTISFWAKAATGTPKIALEFVQNFGTGGSPSSSVDNYVGQVTLSTSWARYSASYTLPSISGKTLGTNSNSDFLQLNLWVSAGSDAQYSSRTGSLGIQSNTFDVWGVQVEAGSTATAFQTATGTIEGELAACQRYYFRNSAASNANTFFANGFNNATTSIYGLYNFPVSMRTAPTLETSGTASHYRIYSAAGFTTCNAVPSLGDGNTSGVIFTAGVASGLTAGQGSVLASNATTSAYLGFSAEL